MKGFAKIISIALCLSGITFSATAQQVKNNSGEGRFTYSIVRDHDTIPLAVLPVVQIVADAPHRLRKKVRRWNRLRNAVYVTYPYARIVAGELKEVDAHLNTLKTKREQEKYLDFKEKEIKSSFGPKIKDLSIYQGKVLIKLIYRETGHNCYNLIKELKGGFSARLWQTVAFVFGSNLKTAYDKEENSDIESIVQEIEMNPFYYNAYRYRSRFN